MLNLFYFFLKRFLQLVDDDPDIIPGVNEISRQEIIDGFQKLSNNTINGVITKDAITKALMTYAPQFSSGMDQILISKYYHRCNFQFCFK